MCEKARTNFYVNLTTVVTGIRKKEPYITYMSRSDKAYFSD